jgi:hypothetical protein
LGATGTSAVLFLGIALTSATPERIAPRELPTLSLAPARSSAPRAEEAKPKPRQHIASDLVDAFKFDPTKSEKPPEVPIGSLDVNAFGGSMKFFDSRGASGIDLPEHGTSGVAMIHNLARTFEVQKPDTAGRVTIFERTQVDEIPVWLYGPQPRVPDRYDREDWNVLVLYTVSERGKTENIFILDTTDPALIDPVKRAITDWKFRAARKGGKPVKMWVQQAVNHIQEFKSPFTL